MGCRQESRVKTLEGRKFSPEPEPRKTRCRWDKASNLIDLEEGDGG